MGKTYFLEDLQGKLTHVCLPLRGEPGKSEELAQPFGFRVIMGEGNSSMKEANRHIELALLESSNTTSPFGTVYQLTRNKIFSTAPFMADLISGDRPVTETSSPPFLTIFSYSTFPPSPSSLLEESPFTEQELDSAFSNLKKGKAPGPDGVDNNIIKLIYYADKKFLLSFFNKCLKHSCFPDILKVGIIVLIRKPDKDPKDPNSYRPICLLSTFGKVLEELILRRLEFHGQQIAPISENQYRFVKGR
ncbi:hypothetical protein AVEN_60577-1 [Araneus ventricosus]|uniref:Reverse transcriptase domain-containing protein n=1 Tax=Araneus ventricosus TaxID=182803 RepID=A0A4Y2F1M9_ARAVE|nr:hypothetical protein AVEN_60577-1 [Araneus ventricosus]